MMDHVEAPSILQSLQSRVSGVVSEFPEVAQPGRGRVRIQTQSGLNPKAALFLLLSYAKILPSYAKILLFC